MPLAAVGGFICCAFYLIGVSVIWTGIFWPSVLSTAVTALYAEILGRILKIPATAIYTPAVVPLIPGSTLYYTMEAIVHNEWTEAAHMANLTGQYALGMAIGMSLVYTVFSMMKKYIKLRNGSREKV